MTHLPDVVVVEIFKNLDICDLIEASSTCSRWMKLVTERGIWTAPRIGLSPQNPNKILNILRCFGRMNVIESIALNCKMTDPVGYLLNGIKLACSSLRKLSIYGQTIAELHVAKELILRSRGLEELILENTRTLFDGRVSVVRERDLQRIQKLHMVNCGFSLTYYLLMLFSGRSNLQHFSIENIPHYVDHVNQIVSMHANSLRHLHVRGTITGEFLRIFCTCVGLESLSLLADNSILRLENAEGCMRIPPTAWSPWVPSSEDWSSYQMDFPSLNTLELANISTLPDSVLLTIANSSLQLQSFSISRCDLVTNESIEKMLLKCTELRQFKLDEMKGVSCYNLVKFVKENDITNLYMVFKGMGFLWKFANIMKCF